MRSVTDGVCIKLLIATIKVARYEPTKSIGTRRSSREQVRPETPFDLPNICFMGTVVSGIGCGVVALTGPRTAFGRVASAIAEQR
jgi:magnesium-transporting ATPase (P-type)